MLTSRQTRYVASEHESRGDAKTYAPTLTGHRHAATKLPIAFVLCHSSSADATSITGNPSLRAAVPSRSSSVTISKDAGRRSAARNAAASWSASAARKGCTRRNRPAASRMASLGSISCQLSASCRIRLIASVIAGAASAPSRSSRAKAETHSTSEPHHTSMAASFAASACRRRVDTSATSSGTIAEASQNLTDPSAALR